MKKNIAILIDEEVEHPKDYRYYSIDEINDLNSVYENIYIADLIDYLQIKTIPETLEKISNKLEKNGQLHIKGPDILQMCWHCSKFHLDLSHFRGIIYHPGRVLCYTLDEIISMISQIKNIKVKSAFYVNAYEYSITAIKNESN